jgi:hypothetical protein
MWRERAQESNAPHVQWFLSSHGENPLRVGQTVPLRKKVKKPRSHDAQTPGLT